ncbi:short chain dehydrogenase domain-containing protein [Pochonia chlamydosporia 170]|uniref:Short chain dehydrogenase domain-containing protein n=1 Tax=Pochonia chlamydosporia 170 TaxID=1380566 RepID=A0A179FCV1_METCM|nr:short chain dehydrogenase domain-containing protein [Pochonia chlamydosporia 170]OAQ62883.1 short chain dehydrogenase domain-containing protein [Pochonia chlamydosporia 170]
MGINVLYILAAIAAIGAGTLVLFGKPARKFISFHFRTPTEPLQKYKWADHALIAGGSTGIGLGIAKELVKHGFAVFLTGNVSDELQAAKASIQSATPGARVTCVIVDAVNASANQIDGIADIFRGLRVSILVNNVGETLGQSGRHSAAGGDAMSHSDRISRFTARLTIAMLPLLSQGRSRYTGGLVFNILDQGVAMPYSAMYDATTAFSHRPKITNIFWELKDALEGGQIHYLDVAPGDLLSQRNSKYAASKAEYVGKRVILNVDEALKQSSRAICPYWWHDLKWRWMSWMKKDVLDREEVKTIGIKRDGWDAYAEDME